MAATTLHLHEVLRARLRDLLQLHQLLALRQVLLLHLGFSGGSQWSPAVQKSTAKSIALNPSEKYEFVNWDDEIPNISGKIKNGNQTTNQWKIQYFWRFPES